MVTRSCLTLLSFYEPFSFFFDNLILTLTVSRPRTLSQVFLSVALILGDGLYNFIKILLSTIVNIHDRLKNKNLPGNMNRFKFHFLLSFVKS